ncbi:MAG: SPOR domain-containing protein [Rhodobacteraceae bacterium]|nr:SPOR domain-containing protein [Paracoccaceae bacterium]
MTLHVPKAVRLLPLALVLSAGPVAAGPAEEPPEGFAGATYVDSAGCAFQRAEIGGTVVWADRLAADGQPICGLVPLSVRVSASDLLPEIPRHRRGSVPEFPEPGRYVQVGAFTGQSKADALVVDLAAAGIGAWRQDFPRNGGTLRIIYAGPLGEADRAEVLLRQIRAMGYPDAFLWTRD